MARRTVKIGTPTNRPDRLIKLGNAIVAKHQENGANSPLDPAKMERLKQVIEEADRLHEDTKRFAALSQAARQHRDKILGVAADQGTGTDDTGLHLIVYARKHLALLCDGREQELGSYGFDVTLGTASRRKSSPAAEVSTTT
jgi:hypothetical protein